MNEDSAVVNNETKGFFTILSIRDYIFIVNEILADFIY
jgi:hypothetical protein